MRAAKRDANEREMVEAWRALGALWIPMGPDAGFDGLLIFHGKIHIIEVKDTSQTNGRYRLTDNEAVMMSIIEHRGAKYTIITNMTEALALVGAG
jgi:hypothetical protein